MGKPKEQGRNKGISSYVSYSTRSSSLFDAFDGRRSHVSGVKSRIRHWLPLSQRTNTADLLQLTGQSAFIPGVTSNTKPRRKRVNAERTFLVEKNNNGIAELLQLRYVFIRTCTIIAYDILPNSLHCTTAIHSSKNLSPATSFNFACYSFRPHMHLFSWLTGGSALLLLYYVRRPQ